MAGPSAPSSEHSHRAAPPPDPSVPTPCREAPAPELPVRFAAARIDRQAAACRQRIVTDRVREEGKCAPPPGVCPGYCDSSQLIGCVQFLPYPCNKVGPGASMWREGEHAYKVYVVLVRVLRGEF